MQSEHSLSQETAAIPVAQSADGLRVRHVVAPLVIGAGALIAMLAVADFQGLPIRDPDAKMVGSPLALIALIVLVFVGIDVFVRAIRESGLSAAKLYRFGRAIFLERWWGRRGVIVISSIVGFYATYLAYRNLKSFLPAVTDGVLHDPGLLSLDKAMFFGTPPSTLLHDLLGTGISAQVLSFVYLGFLTFVPVSLGVALVWSSRLKAGVWYVTALTIDWVLGVLSYYLLPTLGPVYSKPGLFSDLPDTGVSKLQHALLQERADVVAQPFATDAVQSIAGFASLHVAVVLTAALIVQLAGAPRVLKAAMWTFFGLTILATLYFGWHFAIDDVAGVGIAVVAVYGGAALTGMRPAPLGRFPLPRRRGAEA